MDVSPFDNVISLRDVRYALQASLEPKYGSREATAMARIVMMSLKKWDLPHLLANEEREASDYIKGRAEEILGQLMKDVPLQYALGETKFYGLDLKMEPGVLIPRPETEELVDIIVRENRAPDLHVLDICSGSGAIAFALARNLPFSQVEAVDLSERAITLSKENNRQLHTDVKIKRGDVFTLSLPDNSFDIIVSNPPYIETSEKADMEANVLEHEPEMALFVPDDNPLAFYERIADLAAGALTDGGRLYFEINPRHASQLKEILRDRGLEEVEIMKDSSGKERFAKALKP